MRARNIKPGFFNNEELAECSALSRLLFIGTWMAADREGRFEDRPKRLKMQLFPLDDISVDDALQELADHGFIIRYEHDGARYVQIKNFLRHQNPHYKEPPSVIPPPSGWQDSGYVATGVPESKRQAIFDRDGRACQQCGATDQLSLDHVIPRSKGGTDADDNLQTLCRSCNSAKNNRLASADLKASSANDRPSIDQPSASGRVRNPADSLIPDSQIPDTGFLEEDDARARAAATAETLCMAVFINDDEAAVLEKVLRSFELVPDFSVRDGPLEAEKFGRYFAAPKKHPADWYLTWINWIKRAVTNPERRNGHSPPKQMTADERSWENMKRADAMAGGLG